MPIWSLIGATYYAACFGALYRLSMATAVRAQVLPVTLIVAVMATSGAWNYIFFRCRRWQLSFWYLFPYSALVLAMVYTLSRVDRLSGFLFLAYLIYLPYAFAWAYRIWKLNRQNGQI